MFSSCIQVNITIGKAKCMKKKRLSLDPKNIEFDKSGLLKDGQEMEKGSKVITLFLLVSSICFIFYNLNKLKFIDYNYFIQFII